MFPRSKEAICFQFRLLLHKLYKDMRKFLDNYSNLPKLLYILLDILNTFIVYRNILPSSKIREKVNEVIALFFAYLFIIYLHFLVILQKFLISRKLLFTNPLYTYNTRKIETIYINENATLIFMDPIESTNHLYETKDGGKNRYACGLLFPLLHNELKLCFS